MKIIPFIKFIFFFLLISPIVSENIGLPFYSNEDHIIQHTNYTLNYSEKHEQASWVAYKLSSINIKGGYKRTDNFREDKLYESIRDDLYQISDLDKVLRLMSLNIISPYNFYSAFLSYEFVTKLFRKLHHLIDKKYMNDIDKFNLFMKEVKETIDFKKISNDPIEQIKRSIFHKNNFMAIDDIDEDILYYNNRIDIICNRLSKFIDDKKDCIKVSDGKDGEWLLYCTKRRANIFKQKINNLANNNILIKDNNDILYTLKKDDFSYKIKDGNNVIIQFKLMSEISKKKYDLYKRLSKFNKLYYDETIIHYYDIYSECLKNINQK